MFCTGCGNTISEAEKFCKECGTKNNYYNSNLQFSTGSQTIQAVPEQSGQAPQAAPVDQQAAASADQQVAAPTDLQTAASADQQAAVPTGQEASAPAGSWTGLSESQAIQPEVVILPVDQMDQREALGEAPKLEAGNVIVKPANTADKKEKKPAKVVGTGAKVGSVFLSILAFLLTFTFLVALFLKLTLSQGALEVSIQKINYTGIELGELLADSDLDIDVEEGDTTIDVVYEALSEHGRVDISKGDVEEIFEETSFTDYISEKLSGYARYAVTGAEPDEITAREIVRLVQENRDEIEEITDLEITSEDLDELESYLEEDGVLDSISLDKIDETLEEKNVDKLRTFFSNTVLLIIIIVALLLLIGDIVLISRLHRKVKAPLSYIGIPVLTAGLLFTTAFIVLSITKSRIFMEIKGIYNSIKPFIASILTRGILIGVITTLIGILMVVGYIIIKKQQKKDKVHILAE